MFTTSTQHSSLIDGNLTEDSTLKELFLQFVKLQDKESNIGFTLSVNVINGESKSKIIQGILSATGKILKIEGVNADDFIGKQWDELSNLMVN